MAKKGKSSANGSDPGNGEQPKSFLDIPVQFGGVSIGKTTLRVSLKVSRSEMEDVREAERLFCGRRLSGKIALDNPKDSPGQMVIWEDMRKVIEGSFDVHRFGCSAEYFTTGLTFNKNEIETSQIAEFTSGTGRLAIFSANAIPEGEIVEEVSEDEEEDSETASDPVEKRPIIAAEEERSLAWRDISIDAHFKGGILKAMKKHGFATLGNLADYAAEPPHGFDGIDGIGEQGTKTIDAILRKVSGT